MYSKQETFDIVVNHLRKQGAQSSSEDGSTCLYRGPEGRKCAVGFLIPDELYSPEMEGLTLFRNRDEKSLVGRIVEDLGHDLEVAENLQQVHDDFTEDFWEKEFKYLAEKHGLKYTPERSGT